MWHVVQMLDNGRKQRSLIGNCSVAIIQRDTNATIALHNRIPVFSTKSVTRFYKQGQLAPNAGGYKVGYLVPGGNKTLQVGGVSKIETINKLCS
jgi:hypothetical protein